MKEKDNKATCSSGKRGDDEKKSLGRKRLRLCYFLVGDTGIEPVTSSV